MSDFDSTKAPRVSMSASSTPLGISIPARVVSRSQAGLPSELVIWRLRMGERSMTARVPGCWAFQSWDKSMVKPMPREVSVLGFSVLFSLSEQAESTMAAANNASSGKDIFLITFSWYLGWLLFT